jgi:hypothetical protein
VQCAGGVAVVRDGRVVAVLDAEASRSVMPALRALRPLCVVAGVQTPVLTMHGARITGRGDVPIARQQGERARERGGVGVPRQGCLPAQALPGWPAGFLTGCAACLPFLPSFLPACLPACLPAPRMAAPACRAGLVPGRVPHSPTLTANPNPATQAGT